MAKIRCMGLNQAQQYIFITRIVTIIKNNNTKHEKTIGISGLIDDDIDQKNRTYRELKKLPCTPPSDPLTG
ncbi:UNVERIFIED_CONTAM: hypothetical protein NCL1_25159 [Trichonephila clavipes]